MSLADSSQGVVFNELRGKTKVIQKPITSFNAADFSGSAFLPLHYLQAATTLQRLVQLRPCAHFAASIQECVARSNLVFNIHCFDGLKALSDALTRWGSMKEGLLV